MVKFTSASNPGPSPVVRKWIINAAKIGIAFEVLTFVGFYGVYYQMQKSPAFNTYMNDNFPLVIETSKKVGDFYDSINPFKEAIDKWIAEKKD